MHPPPAVQKTLAGKAVLQLSFPRLCCRFETTLGQARLHMLAHILNITYDDTPSTQMATL
jgi:hypothetical protein